MSLPDDLRSSLDSMKAIDNPDLHRLKQADKLLPDPDNNLTEFSNDECIDFALIEALHKAQIINLSGTMVFFDVLKRNRTALDRKRTDEYIKAVIGQVQPLPMSYSQVGAPGSFGDEIKKPSAFQRFKEWMKS